MRSIPSFVPADSVQLGTEWWIFQMREVSLDTNDMEAHLLLGIILMVQLIQHY